MLGSFHWNDRFLTGLPEVDAQHQELVDLINRFGDCIAGELDAGEADLDTVFADLADYARFHFATEEGLMARVGIDPRHSQRQQEQHRAFIRKLTSLREACATSGGGGSSGGSSSGGGSSSDGSSSGGATSGGADNRRLMKFLVRWLANHILGSDQIMGRQIIAIQAGMRPEEAYRITEQVGEDEERRTEPLVDALNDLYREVADRNRELIALNRSLEAKVAERTAELVRANQQLEAMAMTDQLTGLPNRRHAMAALERLWLESSQKRRPLACMLIDADGFKQVNDCWGHDAGDDVLRALATCIRHAVRTDDLVCRLGGDEFLILCPNTGLPGGLHLADLVRRTVERLHVPTGDGEWTGSISVGVAERLPAMPGHEALIKAADDGLYQSKERGRNCVASVQ